MAKDLPAPQKSDAAEREEFILAFWKEHGIFQKSLDKDAPNGEFTFYDGPPFATGLPHAGSLLSSVSKDLIPRYKTMRGYRVRRRWGWDTHGLPIESLVEKELGLKNKKEILAMGVEAFNEKARSMVMAYVHDWKRYVERVGRFVDFDNSYKTMDASFMESVWWGLKTIHDKGHLYEGRKVLMYCPRDETPLAKAEIAMDNTYKDVTDISATAKFKVADPTKHGLPENTYFLAWTTTPWTLPGNVALAVGPEILYAIVEKKGEHLVLAKDLLEANGFSDFMSERRGAELVGIRYEPLYALEKVTAFAGKKWLVVPADFVTTESGTGIVHTAVIYGEDDYQVGLREGLPMVPMLNANATYNLDAPEFLHGQYIKKAEPIIIADLESRGLMFSTKPYTHSYPHCYRCGTALIYNAVSSWFINIQAVKDKLLQENESISWAPAHLKHGRFQHIIDTAPDWTISRNRFWATPLPIWKDAAGNVTVIGSLEELKARTKKSGNTYVAIRHGEAENNTKNILSCDPVAPYGLTDLGRSQVLEAARTLKENPPTKIFVSPFVRTRETAELLAKELGLGSDAIVFDARIGEFNAGDFNERPLQDFIDYRRSHAHDEVFPNGESVLDVKRRVGEFLYEIERDFTNERILIVTHGAGFEALLAVSAGADASQTMHTALHTYVKNGEVRELPFVPLPHNRDYELDFHLPYIDHVQLVDDDGAPLTRIPEVVDCWVESGSMPFAEYHYPFENKESFEMRTPGDFVSEYIGQTRAWFYYMHAIGVELFGKAPFKHVLTTGTILASNGEKLSKSKKNYTDPYALFDLYSADAFRFYLMSSVVMQAEDLTFRDEDVKEVQNKVVNMLRNVLAFYSLYSNDTYAAAPSPTSSPSSTHVLDRWILTRLDQVTANATDALDVYDVTRATRPIRGFIDDLSTWYLRRSRDRMKIEGSADAAAALQTLRHVLTVLSKVIAPVMPFLAEEVYGAVKVSTDPESVHLCAWPAIPNDGDSLQSSEALLSDMALVRELASGGLMLRQKANIKVRQPLQTFTAPKIPASSELIDILRDELNVKEVRAQEGEMTLDTELTPTLIAEGDVRAFMRAYAEARKTAGLEPKDMVVVTVAASEQSAAFSILTGIVLPGARTVSFVEALNDDMTSMHNAELSFGPVPFSLST